MCEVWYESVVVCISACEGMGVCLRGSASGRVRLCWDSQLFHGAVPGSTAGLVGVYWQPVCVCLCVCVSLHHFFSDWVLVHSCLATHPLFPSCPHTTHLLLNFITLNSGSEPCLSNSNYPSRMMHLLCCRYCHCSFRVTFSIKTL